MTLPSPSPVFEDRKAKILEQLAVPDADYTDLSPKGSVDEAIRPLLGEINATAGFVSTSSCAGRVSVFLEGRKASAAAPTSENTDEGPSNERLAGIGGKGGGGTWLYVSHDRYPEQQGKVDWIKAFNLNDTQDAMPAQNHERRLIHFKFEPMILHILTASHEHAQLLLRCALQAGFRESGAVSLTPATPGGPSMPIVAVRSMGLSLESLIGYEDATEGRKLLVPAEHLDILMQIADERFIENTRRIERFAAAFREALIEPVKKNAAGEEWEDAAARKERMRAEGLKRQAELKAKASTAAAAAAEETSLTNERIHK